MGSVSDNNKMETFLRVIYIILNVLLLVLSYLYRFFFFVGCSICAVLFGFIQIWLVSVSRKDEPHQKKKGKLAGFILLIPVIVMITSGVALLFLPDTEMPTNLSYGAVVVLTIMAVGLSAHIFVLIKDKSLVAKFLRYTDCAALSSPVSLYDTTIRTLNLY